MIMTVNAGTLSPEHWAQDPKIGGGRIIGEGCHFVDLLVFLSGSTISDFSASKLGVNQKDTLTMNLSFANGSIGSIHYFSNGNRNLSKERLEIFFNNKVITLDNFIKLSGYGIKNFSNFKKFRQNKGHIECAKAFVESINQGISAIPIEQIYEVSETVIKINDLVSLK